jgi:hypothetical protein
VVVKECGWWCSGPSLAGNWYCTANLYVASPSYAVEYSTPFRGPAVTSEKCAISPESDILELRTWSRRTGRLDRKSDELRRLLVSFVSGYF